MAIVNDEYGPYDEATGTRLYYGGDEGQGPIYMTYGNESVPSVRWAGAGSTATAPTWETSAGGDYRRQARSMWGDPDPNYFGGAGQMHQYDFQKQTSPGVWDFVNPGEHNEEANYFWTGLNSPGYQTAAQKAEAERTALDNARLATPGAIGQALTRSEASLTGGGNEDDFRQELAFYSHLPETTSALSQYYTPEMKSAISNQISQSTPGAQAAREPDDDFLSTIAPLLLAGAGMYFGMPGISSLFGSGGAAGVGALAEGFGGAGILGDAAMWGLGETAATGAAAGALGDLTWAGGNYAWPSVGGEGLSGLATGALDGTAGALGSVSGAAGLTGTIPGLGTLTAEGMLIPAAGGAAVPLSSLSSWDLNSVVDMLKSAKSGVSSLSSALGGGAARTGAGTGTGGGSGIGFIPVGQNKSILEIMMSEPEDNGLDEFTRLMAQSGKGD